MNCKKCGGEIAGIDYYIGVYNDTFHIQCPKGPSREDLYKLQRYKTTVDELRPKFKGKEYMWIQLNLPVACMIGLRNGLLECKNLEVPFFIELDGELYEFNAKIKNFWRLTDKGRKEIFGGDGK